MKLKSPAHYASAIRRRLSLVAVAPRLAAHQKHHNQSVIILGTPVHSNLGDHAIVHAQKQLLSDIGLGDSVFEVPRPAYERMRDTIDQLIRPNDLIVIDGGGNVGTLWPEENDLINSILTRFKDNRIIMFPQTAFFEDSPTGEETRGKTARVLAEHPNLTFFSRDLPTFETITALSPKTVNYLVPDIVPYLELGDFERERKGALLCLRADKEKVVSDEDSRSLEQLLKNRTSSVTHTSTLSDQQFIDSSTREKVLRDKWREFAGAEIVVTDRLHGMLFSAITGTPCVALDNVSHKVLEGASWLKDVPNIQVINSSTEAEKAVEQVLEAGPLSYKRGERAPYYDQIKQAVIDALQ